MLRKGPCSKWNSFMSRTAFYWPKRANDEKIRRKFALNLIDVKLCTKGDYIISQSYAEFYRDRLNKFECTNSNVLCNWLVMWGSGFTENKNKKTLAFHWSLLFTLTNWNTCICHCALVIIFYFLKRKHGRTNQKIFLNSLLAKKKLNKTITC